MSRLLTSAGDTASAGSDIGDELVARARSLRDVLVERQAETEARTYYSEETHRDFLEAGFYRMLVPRRYGGYELDLPTFCRVVIEIARGCPSTGWSLCLPSGHTLMVASWFSEQAQDEIFDGNADFRCPAVAAPFGTARRADDGGWIVDGTHAYCSGAPWGTHYLGQAFDVEVSGRQHLFVVPRESWTEMLDDWGDVLGLRGSGSHSLRFDNVHVPSYFVLEGTSMLDVDVSGGTPGSRLHGNSMYSCRGPSFFAVEFAALMIGMAKGALDEYERILRSRKTQRAPIVFRSQDPDYQRWFGYACGKLEAAEAMLLNLAQQYMETCRRNVHEGVPFDSTEDMRLNIIGREAVALVWEAVEQYIYKTAGTGAARTGGKLERTFRDISMAWGHYHIVLGDWSAQEYGRGRLGVGEEES